MCVHGVSSTWSPMQLGFTVLGPSATQPQLLLGAVWMGKEDGMPEVLGSSWKAVPSPLAMVHLQAIRDISVAVVAREVSNSLDFHFRGLFPLSDYGSTLNQTRD